MTEHIAEGLTVLYEGPQRSGKTLIGAIMAYASHKEGRSVFSNISFNFPHDKLDFKHFILEDGQSRFRNGHIFLDELNFYFDCRGSMSARNKKFAAYLLQQKKQGCHLTGTTHELQYLDLRLRGNYDYLIKPTALPAYPKAPRVLKLVIESGPTRKYKRVTRYINCERFLGMYDSFAVYNPFEDEEERPVRRAPRVTDL